MKDTNSFFGGFTRFMTVLILLLVVLVLGWPTLKEIFGYNPPSGNALQVPVIEVVETVSALPTVPPQSELLVAGASMASEEDLSQTTGQANETDQVVAADGNAVGGNLTIIQGSVNFTDQEQTTVDEAVALIAPPATPLPPTPTPLPTPTATPDPTPTPRLITVDGTVVVMVDNSIFSNKESEEPLAGATVDIYPRSGGPRYVAYANEEGWFTSMVPEDPLGYDLAVCGTYKGEVWSTYIQQMLPTTGGKFTATLGNSSCRYDE